MEKQVIGGQAVMEGVMMRSPQGMAIAVRDPQGHIQLDRQPPTAKAPWKKIPLIRGVVNFVDMMKLSMQTLTISAKLAGLDDEVEEPNRFEKWLSKVTGKNAMDIAMGFALVLGLAFAVGLFILLPNLISSLIQRWVPNGLLLNLVEGVLRLGIFVGYLFLVSRMKEIRRFFAYHGAEHRVVNCYEAGLPLTCENAQRQVNANPRCGTSFMILVMLVSIVVFSLTGWTGAWWGKLLLRLALLPVVASLSYELLMLLARHDNGFTCVLRAPGMWMQRLTTRDPEDAMVEVALAAFIAVMRPEERALCVPEDYRLPDEEEPMCECTHTHKEEHCACGHDHGEACHCHHPLTEEELEDMMEDCLDAYQARKAEGAEG